MDIALLLLFLIITNTAKRNSFMAKSLSLILFPGVYPSDP